MAMIIAGQSAQHWPHLVQVSLLTVKLIIGTPPVCDYEQQK
jgi:hypothetical protein